MSHRHRGTELAAAATQPPHSAPVLSIRGAELRFGSRWLWQGLDLDVEPGELIAVLGPNGAGKTTLFRAILGQQRLTSGSISVLGSPARRGNPRIGFIPQQRIFPPDAPLRGRDLVTLGRTGVRWGLPFTSRADREAIELAIATVGAGELADRPIGSLSGGEQQRLRVAEALVHDPVLLLCDEPLSSLDLGNQRAIVDLIASQRRHGTAIMFVAHDINPILGLVDRILYLAPGGHRVGGPGQVLRSEVLTSLYGTPVDVVRLRGRIVVVGGPDDSHHTDSEPDFVPDAISS